MTDEEIEREVDEHLDSEEEEDWEDVKEQCHQSGHNWHGSLCWTCFKTRENKLWKTSTK